MGSFWFYIGALVTLASGVLQYKNEKEKKGAFVFFALTLVLLFSGFMQYRSDNKTTNELLKRTDVNFSYRVEDATSSSGLYHAKLILTFITTPGVRIDKNEFAVKKPIDCLQKPYPYDYVTSGGVDSGMQTREFLLDCVSTEQIIDNGDLVKYLLPE